MKLKLEIQRDIQRDRIKQAEIERDTQERARQAETQRDTQRDRTSQADTEGEDKNCGNTEINLKIFLSKLKLLLTISSTSLFPPHTPHTFVLPVNQDRGSPPRPLFDYVVTLLLLAATGTYFNFFLLKRR